MYSTHQKPSVQFVCTLEFWSFQKTSLKAIFCFIELNHTASSLWYMCCLVIPQTVWRSWNSTLIYLQFLFTQLSNVISIVKLHIKPYLHDIFAIIDMTWSSNLENPEQSEDIQVITIRSQIEWNWWGFLTLSRFKIFWWDCPLNFWLHEWFISQLLVITSKDYCS